VSILPVPEIDARASVSVLAGSLGVLLFKKFPRAPPSVNRGGAPEEIDFIGKCACDALAATETLLRRRVVEFP